MAIDIKETFEVAAPIGRVWQFVMDPHKVAACMPGAQLDEVIDERTYRGSIKVKVGAIVASYSGKVELTRVDESGYAVEMSAEGTETGGGTAKGTMSSRLRKVEDGRTELVAEATVDLTGRVMQVGRGMIQGVSHQLFKQFVARATRELEAPADQAPAAEVAAGSEADAIRVVPLVFQTIVAAIVGFFRRLFRRPAIGE